MILYEFPETISHRSLLRSPNFIFNNLNIDRVGKRYVVIVPCINTPFEPHVESFRWQLRGIDKKKKYNTQPLIYLSDEAWLSFKGFKNAKINRFWYIPGIKSEIVIHN